MGVEREVAAMAMAMARGWELRVVVRERARASALVVMATATGGCSALPGTRRNRTEWVFRQPR